MLLRAVDDEYVVVGSANCNQRSMDGGRDSEIAIGAYQPQHLADEEQRRLPEGQVRGFRMSLWYEHLGELHEDFERPERIECVHKVQSMASSFWNLYTQDAVADMPGHLLPYPITVSSSGDVLPLPGHETFPDTKAPVLGTHSAALPSMLTV
jgi:phospholipase D1/2